MLNKIKISTMSDSPFQRGDVGFLSFGQDPWVGYVFGALFILIGILCFTLISKSKRKVEQYKQRQIDDYNTNHSTNKKLSDYNKVGLYLPSWEKAKSQMPVMLGLLMIIIGISWIVGNTLTSL